MSKLRPSYQESEVKPVVQQKRGCYSVGDIIELPGAELAQIVSIDRKGARLEPIGITRGALDKSLKDYGNFAGKPADRVLKFPAQCLKGTGWKLGTLCGVLYEADLDEGKTLFYHPFKKRARPTLAVLNNGRTLATLGGAFRVTERGIVDQ